MSESYDLIIIGAGPAGLAAGLYAGRYRLNTLIFEKMAVGGQIILSPSIENYPGFPGGITTDELVARLRKHAEETGVKIIEEEIISFSSADSSGTFYEVKTKENIYKTKTIILATGAQAKQLGVPGESRLVGRGVSYCGTCDGPLFRDKDIVVIGAGDRAIEEAIFLSGYAGNVTVIHRRDELRASKILVEKAKENPKIKFIFSHILEEISGKDKVLGIRIKNLKDGLVKDFSCQGVFIFVGISPNTFFLKDTVKMNEEGFILTDEDMRTNLKGVFAVGDCRKKSLYQVICASSDGAIAAHLVHKYLL